MKNNLSSPRFLYEFDTVDTLALRNISEKRKLKQKLGELDKQLHSNLVRMDSEILSLRLENFETSPKLQRMPKPKESISKINVAKANTKLSKSSQKEPINSPEMMDTTTAYLNESVNADQATPKLSPHSILPKITTTSYLIAKQSQFDENLSKEEKLMDESCSLETISEMDEKKMQAKQRILMSLQHPIRTKQKLQSIETSCRPPTPQASNHFLSPLRPIDKNRRASSQGLLAPLPSEYVTKGRLYRAFSAPDVSNSLSLNETEGLRDLPKRQKQSHHNEAKGPEAVANGIRICVTSENISSRNERKTKLKMDPAPSLEVGPESKNSNFDYVLGRRLRLLEDGVPEREDLERIRYLRVKEENENDEIEDIFAVLHQNNSD